MAISTSGEIDINFYENILSKTLEQVSFDKYGYAAKGKEDLEAYLTASKLSDTEKAKIYADWVSKVTENTIQSAIQAATSLASANSEFSIKSELVAEEKAKLIAETARINAETSLTAQRELTEVQNTAKALADVATAGSQKALLDAQALTEAEKTALITEQTQSEAKQNELNGVIDTQIAKIIADTTLTTTETARVTAQTGLITEQTESEAKQNVTNGILDKQLAKLVSDTALVDSNKALVDAQELKVDIEAGFITEQKESEALRNALGGLIEKEIALKSEQILTQAQETARVTAQKDLISQQEVSELAKVNPTTAGVVAGSIMDEEANLKSAQAVSFEAHPAKVALDGITNVMQMTAAAGEVPGTAFVADHSKITLGLAAKSNITTLGYSGV